MLIKEYGDCFMNNVLLPRMAAEKIDEVDYDLSDFDYDEDPKKKREDKLDSPDEEVPVEEWEEETEDTTDYDSGDSEY